jgi:hypothetical protein
MTTGVNIVAHQTPVDQGIIHKGLQYRHEGLLVIAQDSHCDLASVPEGAFNATDLVIDDLNNHR